MPRQTIWIQQERDLPMYDGNGNEAGEKNSNIFYAKRVFSAYTDVVSNNKRIDPLTV